MPSALEVQALEIETMLEEQGDLLPEEVRGRLDSLLDAIRYGRRDEMIPPNIPVDEPIPGQHPGADEARAASPTGDLPRTDREAPKPPEEMIAPHAFAKPTPVRKPSVADLNPEMPPPIAEHGPRAFPPLPPVERALP
jgi:hypothetical protein